MNVQVIGHRTSKHKTALQREHPKGHVRWTDFSENGCFWLFGLAFLVLFVVFIILHWTVPTPTLTPPAFKRNGMRERNPRLKQSVKRTVCLTGETFDQDLQMCGPTFHSPLAFDGSIMDTNKPACDSFFHSMCGRWIAQHTNENRAFSYGYHKNLNRIQRLILGSPTDSPINKFYASCMSIQSNMGPGVLSGTRESKLEMKHTMELVLGDVRSHADLPNVFGRLARLGYTAPWAFSIERHPTEPRMIPLITFDSFPASLDESRIYQLLSHYREVTNYNILEMEQRITAILRIMRELRARNTNPMEAIVDYETYVQYTFPNDLVLFGTGVPQEWNLKGYSTVRGWNNYFQSLDGQALRLHHDQQVWVIGKQYIRWLLTQGLAAFDISEWKAYVEFSIIYNGVQFEPDLPHDVYFKQHDKRGPLGPGGRLYHRLPRTNTSHVQSPQDKCVSVTHSMIPGLVSKTFLDNYFPDKALVREDVSKLVDRLRQALIDRVQASSWLSSDDKQTFVTKIRATLVRVAEPDEWEAEPFAERLAADRYDHNMNLIRRYRVQRNLGLWHKDEPSVFDRSAAAHFLMPLTDTNAYYSGQSNSIAILAGILQPPFYSVSYNQVSKHAILGSIIGHEMSHMLDHHGIYWDKDGSLKPKGIISEAGVAAFYNQSDCVIREYGPSPAGCEDVNVAYGNSTVGEDLADLTGIGLSFDAYFKFTDAGRAAPLGDKQHFFMVLSQAFCETMDQESKCEAVKSDVHAIAEFRIDRTLRNMGDFQDAFGCHAGQAMYRKADEMCKVY